MARSLRVTFVVNSLGFGGAERQTLSLFRDISSMGITSTLAVLKEQAHELPESRHIPHLSVWRGYFDKGVDLRGVWRLAKFLRSFSPTLLVTVNSYPLLMSYLALAITRLQIPIINVFHTTELPDTRSRRQFPVFQSLMNRIDKVVYVCEAQRKYWTARGLRMDKSTVIHNGISTDYGKMSMDTAVRQRLRRSLGFNADDIVVGICAALRPEKAHMDLVRAIVKLRAIGLPFKAIFIGDGPCRMSLQENIDRLGMRNAIVMAGLQSDPKPFVAIADIMALVSHSVETFSIAALEAMALSKPLVLSNIGGAPEQVTDGFNGYLYEKGDVGQLVHRLASLSNRETRLQMGANGAGMLRERFTVEMMVQRYADLFRYLHRSAS